MGVSRSTESVPRYPHLGKSCGGGGIWVRVVEVGVPLGPQSLYPGGGISSKSCGGTPIWVQSCGGGGI